MKSLKQTASKITLLRPHVVNCKTSEDGVKKSMLFEAPLEESIVFYITT